MTAPFIEDFYPTPKPLIERMLEGIKFSEVSEVIDLGAGRGDIAEYITELRERGYYHRTAPLIDVVEINPEFQHILKGKGFRLIHDDILSFRTYKIYDLIVANFPFSIGAECLQVALSLLERSGGHLRCLVNAETIRKPYTNLRKWLVGRLDELGAEIEFLPGEFTSAERPTKVEGALIKLHVRRPEAPSILLDSMKKAEAAEVGEAAPGAALVENNYTAAMVAQFNLECRLGVRLIDEWFALKPHVIDRIKQNGEAEDYAKPLIELKVEHAYNSKASFINNYLSGLRHKFWALLLNDPRFNGLYTSNILNELRAKLTELKDYDFTLFNIQSLIEEMRGKIVEGIEASILALFDKLTREFAYDSSIQNGNVWFYSGWKSNKAHKVNRKVILPMYLLESGFSGLRFNFRAPDELRDMVKVFNYLDENRADIRLLVSGACASAERREDFRDIDLRFFDISCFKKGTVHIKFTNQRLLDKFNIFAAQRKKWLPPAYGTKPYEDMNAEEREVVDNFQGREAYEQVYKERAYYIVDSAALLELAGDGEQAAEVATVPMLAAAPVEAEAEEQTPHLVLVAQATEAEPVEAHEAEPTPHLIEVAAESAPEQPEAEPQEDAGEDGHQRRLFAA